MCIHLHTNIAYIIAYKLKRIPLEATKAFASGVKYILRFSMQELATLPQP
jgi:hypothetical protein